MAFKEKLELILRKRRIKTASILVAFIILSLTVFVSALVMQTSTQSDFDEGSYNQTFYNDTIGAVQVNLSFNNGTYESKVFSTGSNVTFNNLSWAYQRIQCPQNMSYINKLGGFCIDQYEAHALNSGGSLATPPTSAGATDTLIAAGGKAGSAFNQTVWVYIDQTEARTACSNAGKKLCSDEEWLAAANLQGNIYNLPADTASSPYFCVTGSGTYCLDNSPGGGEACQTGANKTGGVSSCVSSEGVYDMVGNVWEWTNETVEYTKPCNQPITGYCYWNGTVFQTGTDANTAVYGNDGVYFVYNTTTNKAVIRGGSWYDGAFAGPFSAYLSSAPTAANYNIGFRCCST